MSNSTTSRITAVLACELPDAKISETTRFADIGMDSLDLISFVAKIEDEFSVKIPDDVIGELEDVRSLADYLCRMQK